MTPWTRNMNERVWYYPPVGNDGFGALVYGAPEERLCRWQDQMKLVRDAQGRESMSAATVYVYSPVVAEGLMFRSSDDYPDGVPPEGSRRIIATCESPSLDQTRVLHKVFLE